MEYPAQFKQLLTFVRTKNEVQNVKDALDLYLSSKFSLQENVDVFSKLPVAVTQILTSLLSKEQSIESLKIFVEQFNQKLTLCPVIHLTITINPTEPTVQKLSSKVRQIFGQDCMLDINVDRRILGGIILIHNGNYMDISLKKKLDQAFSTRQEEIKSLIT